jgi:O-antigen/teichoic acid export membrane protein
MMDTPRNLAVEPRPAAVTITSAESNTLARWISHWGFIIAEFGMVQVVVQALGAAAGLLIVRTLSKQDYALFAIANSMQTTCNLLADVGIGVGVRSIGGRIYKDRYRLGQLLNTALGLRRHFALVSFSLCIPISAWMLSRNGAGLLEIVGLCTAIAFGAIPLLASSIWTSSTQLQGEYRRLQKIDAGNAVLRLALIGVLAFERMNALLAVLVGVVSNWIQAIVLRRWVKDHADPVASTNVGDRRELLRLSVKSLPNAVFFCFQGQVTLLILTVLGNPASIADITALGRLAALLTVFSAVFVNVLAPRFSRCQESTRLPRLYLLFVSGTVLLLLPLVFSAWFLPGPFLWLLGSKYSGLEAECGLVVATSCIAQLSGVLWNLNSGRAWIRIQAPCFIPVILVAQVLAATFLDLRQFHDLLIFNLVTSAAPLPIYALDAYLGLKYRSQPRT